jgi:hypothetical protein
MQNKMKMKGGGVSCPHTHVVTIPKTKSKQALIIKPNPEIDSGVIE